jgi:hypothetical protein
MKAPHSMGFRKECFPLESKGAEYCKRCLGIIRSPNVLVQCGEAKVGVNFAARFVQKQAKAPGSAQI